MTTDPAGRENVLTFPGAEGPVAPSRAGRIALAFVASALALGAALVAAARIAAPTATYILAAVGLLKLCGY